MEITELKELKKLMTVGASELAFQEDTEDQAIHHSDM